VPELADLIEDLVYALEKRETVEPDVAAWEAEAEIRVLERRILGEFRPGLRVDPGPGPAVAPPLSSTTS
jgi:hypothetical protein